MNALLRIAPVLVIAVLAACSTGPVRRVSEPAASIQQLSVRADGSWTVEVRLHNYSSIPMQFDRVELALTIAGQSAGSVQAAPALRVGPESADVVSIAHAPAATARMALTDALAANRAVDYRLEGSVQATPESGKQRSFDVKRDSRLSPVPGLPGVLR
ncbi:MAG: hypothetical protein DI635_05190 [Pseudoxanthomonas suwonensis]|nr:MAG: hypothetical protein DI635_05190 [Pseudoxanthomonas suwonensis]